MSEEVELFAYFYHIQSLSIKPYKYYLDNCLAGGWLSRENKDAQRLLNYRTKCFTLKLFFNPNYSFV